MAPEVGAYSRDKMSDTPYKPPLRFRLALRLQKGGVYAGHYGTSCILVAINVIKRSLKPPTEYEDLEEISCVHESHGYDYLNCSE